MSRIRGGGLAVALAALVVTSTAPAALAGGPDEDSRDNIQQGPDTDAGTGGIGSKVRIRGSANNSGAPMAPATSVGWEPPACWYEPAYKPKEYKELMEASNPNGMVLGDYEDEFYAYKKKRAKQKYNIGKDGVWWALKYDGDRDHEAAGCLDKEPDIFVPKGEPPADPDALDPEKLSKLAYEATRLPAPPVKLSPASGEQVVNLDTRVRFKAPLERVWVTASLDHMGVRIAATTVATPKWLKVSAGSADADPSSCAYDLSGGKGGYQVDSKGADCNITYRRTSGDGTFPFKASLVWQVTWTDSADPDGPPRQPALPDGESTFEQDVTVKEIQSIVRD